MTAAPKPPTLADLLREAADEADLQRREREATAELARQRAASWKQRRHATPDDDGSEAAP